MQQYDLDGVDDSELIYDSAVVLTVVFSFVHSFQFAQAARRLILNLPNTNSFLRKSANASHLTRSFKLRLLSSPWQLCWQQLTKFSKHWRRHPFLKRWDRTSFAWTPILKSGTAPTRLAFNQWLKPQSLPAFLSSRSLFFKQLVLHESDQ